MEDYQNDPEIIEKFLNQYKQAKKQLDIMEDRFNKTEKHFQTELTKERGLNKK